MPIVCKLNELIPQICCGVNFAEQVGLVGLACGMDFMECLAEAQLCTDAEIAEAISQLSVKWGIPLT